MDLKTKPVSGRPRKLIGAQSKRTYDLVTLENPLQLKCPFALWTREMVREPVSDELGVRLSVVSVGRLFKTLGLSPPLAPALGFWVRFR